MFDCIDRPLPSYDRVSAAPVRSHLPRIPEPTLLRRYAGRNWLRVQPRPGRHAGLTRLHELAARLGAEIKGLSDATVLVLDLGLDDTLALSERFAGELRIEASLSLI